MGTPTYTPLAEITLGSSAASVTFSSISQAYRDLVLVINGSRADTSTGGMFATVNGDSGANYSYVNMEGNGSTASSGSGSGWTSLYFEIWGNTTRANWVINLVDYSATDKHKTILGRNDSASNKTIANAQRWASTSAITSITLPAGGSGWIAGSTFSLYGIEA